MKNYLASIGMWVLGVLADLYSSSLPSPNFPESNPFWRHADGTLWLRHALVHSAFQSVDMAFASVAAYIAGRCIGPRTAATAACLPWAYLAYGHFDAALSNYMIYLKLFVDLN